MQDIGCKMQDTGCKMQDARYRMQDNRMQDNRIQDNRNIEKDIIVIPIINCKTTRFHEINTTLFLF